MERELSDALRAGAVGLTTSRSDNHATSDNHPVASRLATWDEVRALVNLVGRESEGVFELALTAELIWGDDPSGAKEFPQSAQGPGHRERGARRVRRVRDAVAP